MPGNSHQDPLGSSISLFAPGPKLALMRSQLVLSPITARIQFWPPIILASLHVKQHRANSVKVSLISWSRLTALTAWEKVLSLTAQAQTGQNPGGWAAISWDWVFTLWEGINHSYQDHSHQPMPKNIPLCIRCENHGRPSELQHTLSG